MREFRLRTWLILLIATAVVLTFSIVGSAILYFRLPQVEERGRMQAQTTATAVALLLDQFMGGVEEQLAPLDDLLEKHSPAELEVFLEAIAADGLSFDAISIIDIDGTVKAIGLPIGKRAASGTLRGTDLSANRLFLNARSEAGKSTSTHAFQWSDRYLSLLTGEATVGVALHAGRHTVIGELSQARLLDMLKSFAVSEEVSVAVIDGQGWRLATNRDNGISEPQRYMDFGTLPSFRAIVAGTPLPKYETINGRRFLVGGVVSPKLGWVIGAAVPAGWDNYSYRTTVILVGVGFIASLLISLSLAPLWAARMARPVRGLITYAHRIAARDYPDAPLRNGPVTELNELGADLTLMGRAIHEREESMVRSEERLRATLENSPSVSMQWYDAQGRVLYWNKASELIYGYSAAEAVGAVISETPLIYLDNAQVSAFLAQLAEIGRTGEPFGPAEFELRRRDGQQIFVLATVFAIPGMGDERIFVCMDVDITEQRRIEREIRQLNLELEERVALRTDELVQANEELEATVSNLKATQEQLVQSAKLAALGNLVAGVAHELNTPIGNGLMATTTLRDKLGDFHAAMTKGLRRSALDDFMAGVNMAVDITTRNLHRAADLVSSFKQLAVDQTSAQRRSFELAEIVHEVLITLQPTLKRTPYLIETDIPSGLLFDSYPGPLGQVLTNLINNAVLHGFDNREHGTIRIKADTIANEQVRLIIADDGKGIPLERQQRIFEPFFTTRLGRGGSGLGLHIVFNTVTGVLGGTISLVSREGNGTDFILTLPRQSPVAVPSQDIPVS